jgi:hypothetical protein
MQLTSQAQILCLLLAFAERERDRGPRHGGLTPIDQKLERVTSGESSPTHRARGMAHPGEQRSPQTRIARALFARHV